MLHKVKYDSQCPRKGNLVIYRPKRYIVGACVLYLYDFPSKDKTSNIEMIYGRKHIMIEPGCLLLYLGIELINFQMISAYEFDKRRFIKIHKFLHEGKIYFFRCSEPDDITAFFDVANPNV